MKGLELAERYFAQVGAPMIEARFPELAHRFAAGLVGHGSECFGFDDALSQDHDWGPGFCVWLTQQDYQAHGQALSEAIDALPRSFAGFEGRSESSWGHDRVGVFEIGGFYRNLTGFDHPPETLDEWRSVSEETLAVATNGWVFTDSLGVFTRFRRALLAFYPEDVRLKKIAARCMAMAQSGQYNFMRLVCRGELVAARFAETLFMRKCMSMAFLMNRVYKPYYKWMHRALQDLPVMGATLHRLLYELVNTCEGDIACSPHERKEELIEAVCHEVIVELRRQGLTDSNSNFLWDHGVDVHSRIEDPELRRSSVWFE